MQHDDDAIFGEPESANRPGPLARMVRAVASRFGATAPEPLETPFRDSDFEADSGFFGRPLGEH
jgi:hypothetical protein